MLQISILCEIYWFKASFTTRRLELKITLHQSNREIHTDTVTAKARGPRFKVSSEGLSTEIDILIWSPIQVLTKADVV